MQLTSAQLETVDRFAAVIKSKFNSVVNDETVKGAYLHLLEEHKRLEDKETYEIFVKMMRKMVDEDCTSNV